MALVLTNSPQSFYTANPGSVNNTPVTASYTLGIQDANQMIEMNSASAITLTIPPNSVVPFAVGTLITIFNAGAGQVQVLPGSGVTRRSRNGNTRLSFQYSVAYLQQIRIDEWYFSGDITT